MVSLVQRGYHGLHLQRHFTPLVSSYYSFAVFKRSLYLTSQSYPFHKPKKSLTTVSYSLHSSRNQGLSNKNIDTITGQVRINQAMANDDESGTGSHSEAFSRLPKTVIPSHYKLTLKPDLTKLVFEGSQEIYADIKTETTEIQINAVDLTITNVSWSDSLTGTKSIPEKVILNKEQETVTLKFSSPLSPGLGKLGMSFSGELNDTLKGFYRSSYKGSDGNERFNAVTQFAPTDARRCFPNWDEPAVKATFDLTLIVPTDRVALSNMSIKATKSYADDRNLQVVEYETTPIMSTYLLAFAIGEFDYVETTSKDGVLCRVYTPPGKKEQGLFALDVASKALPYYRDYFGIAYPLPKLDLIAVADFLYGAMENWGLITYRETRVLIDARESSAATKQGVALTVAHEIAHQWFGNLVTMEWWTHLWLNEGYASFVEFMCVDHIFPEWDIWTQFLAYTHIHALELDCLRNSHPIEVPVNHPKEIEEIFDAISYSKGASVIRMLYNFIGDEAFRRGMNLYLTRHQYGNTVTEDLWKALAEASSKPVEEVMTTWTKQMGFPLIRLTESVQEGNQRRLTLTQEKFTADPKGEVGSQSWLVPLSFSTGTNPGKVAKEALMTEKSLAVNVNDVKTDQWIKVNSRTVGFYRVLYPSEMLSEFLPAIKSKSLPPLDRIGLLDDVFALVQAGKASAVDVLKLMESYVEETDYTCWASLSSITGKLNLLLDYSESYITFKAFARSIFGSVTERTGWNMKINEGHLDSMLRALVLNRMASLDHGPTIKEAERRFALHVSGEIPISSDLRAAVYNGVLSVGDEKTFESVMKLYMNASTQEEKNRIARSMGSMKDETLLKKVLQFSISENVRKQDTGFVLIAVSSTKKGRELAWNFFKENVQKFKDEYPSTLISRTLKTLIENFVTEEKALEIENFFTDHPFPGTERSVQQGLESIRLNQKWLESNLDDVKEFLEAASSG